MNPRHAEADDLLKTILTQEAIAKRVAELGQEISRDYSRSRNLLLISVLKGSVVFMADLMRAVTVPAAVDFMAVSSYGSGVKSSGVVKIVKDIDIELKGMDLLIVEDILDSGMTLDYLVNLLSGRSPASIRIVTLLDKPSRRKVGISANYVGFEVPDEFLVGYGLDYNERYRSLPEIGVLKPEIYSAEV